MPDKMTREQRHRCMASIHSRDTKPEMTVRRYLHSRGFRYRVNVKGLPGSPDIVLRKYRTVIFIHGCFWHGHEGCRYFVMPKSNTDFWTQKITRNQKRDRERRTQLRQMGWHTIVIWECQLKPKTREATLAELEHLLHKTYLDNLRPRKAAVYSLDTEPTPIAAEEQVGYGAIDNSQLTMENEKRSVVIRQISVISVPLKTKTKTKTEQ